MAALSTFLVIVAGAIAAAAAIHASASGRAAAQPGGPASRGGQAGPGAAGSAAGPGGSHSSGADHSGPGSPAPGSSAPGAGAGPVRQDRPGPVLLIPGYGGSALDLAPLAAQINAAGRSAIVLDLPGDGTGDLRRDARLLNEAVARALRRGAPSVDVIGYSAGGVVALLWAREDDGAAKARRVIAIGTPFHGTAVAAAAEAFTPRLCAMACRQLVPGSPLLRGLDARPAPPGPAWLSLWSADDLVVTPPSSARLAGAVNVPVQSVCPGRRINHLQLPDDPVVTAMVLRAIGRGRMRYPAAAACRG